MITEESTIFKASLEVLLVASGHLPAVPALLQISEEHRAFKACSVTDPNSRIKPVSAVLAPHLDFCCS